MDVAILLDGSGSIKGYNFRRLKRFLARLVRSFKVGYYNTRVSIVQFSSATRVEFYLNRYRNVRDVIKAINRIRQMRRGTYLHRGLNMVRTRVFNGKRGDRRRVPNTLIVLTDGATASYKYARNEASRLKRQGVRIVTVGVGQTRTIRKFSYQLKSYASRPLRSTVFLNGFRGLTSIVKRLAYTSCQGE